jgi:hypothetical protein
VDSWSTRFSRSLPLARPRTAPPACRLRHCPGLLCFVGSHLPRLRTHSHHRIPTGTPAPPVISRLHQDCCVARPTRQRPITTSSPEPPCAGPDISYLSPSARPSPPVISSTSPHLRQSRLHHPAPPPTTTRQPQTNISPVDDLFT